ncbi:hypothetical protein GCM10022288_15600 [Gryllotalpicola kribbensis]|uniref:Uncharacterized protein n=1 Tax=Gryllotalpicola kribbensis TaxID=993084 RepID=A0ABP8ARQ8_9MICO
MPAALASQRYGVVYGHGDLWVGAWWEDPDALAQARQKGVVGGDSFGYKYPAWKVVDGQLTDAGGTPRVTVALLDGRGRGSAQAGDYTSERQDDGNAAQWWPTVVEFPSRGCWQVIESIGDDKLVYVVQI